VTYQYKLDPRPPKQNINRITPKKDETKLTGFVHGQKASSNEEKFGRAMDLENREYIFQFYIPTPFQIPGQQNSIDFMDTTEVWTPIEIDDNFTHKSGTQRAQDQLRDQVLSKEMAKEGINPIIRLPVTGEETVTDYRRIIREIF
jgi:hypothetical protein